MMDGLAQARTLLAEAVGSEPNTVPEDARIGLYDPWDSLAHLRLILGLEDRMGRQLDTDEVMGIECLHDVASLLAAHDRLR